MSDKLKFFDCKEDSEKTNELKNKIYPLINGFTSKQIHDAFKFIEQEIRDEYIINLSD